ncbi:hypothetical protein [Micromonospora carbonacea]|uniref:hypothetical protein n=1 Tax=Micromonospora carbonacea TaxID=47853 RepID=UPI000943400B|nr:hypothetical protein [Micromonospora carbonacea]
MVALQTEYAHQVARRVIVRLAPDELPQFASTVRAFDAASWRQRRRASRRNEALGIGVDGVLSMLTISVLYLLHKIMELLADHYAEVTARTVTDRVALWVRRILRCPSPVPARWRPTGEQLATIRTVALREARVLGLTAAQAELVTNAIITELAAGPDEPGSAIADVEP